MEGALASDDRNPNFAGARNPDDVLAVQFYNRAVQDNFKSEKEGLPIFRDEKWVRIMIPGRSDLTVETPVDGSHPQRFPRQWAVFMNQQSETDQMVGTPVTEWPVLTRAQAEELKGKKFYTVQQIAECSDAQITALGMNANSLRQKARAFLSQADKTAQAQSQAAEIARRDEENNALKAQIAKLEEAVVMLQKPAGPAEKKAKEAA